MYSLKGNMLFLFRICFVLYFVLSIAESVFLNSKGEYENLIINIDPEVHDLTFLNNVENIMKTLSRSLFNKTNGRFSIKNVIVVLPPVYNEGTLKNKWKDKIVDLNDETLPKEASILVGTSNLPPLKTVHLGGCGQQGEYIHISPELFGEVTTSLYGNTAYLLLHEWAHYRWGLFDEYRTDGEDSDTAYYLTANKTIKPITCPGNLKGWMLTRDLKPCVRRRQDLLPQPGCQFHLYYKENETLSSALMGYAVSNLDEFCGSSKIQHNPSPPSVHNKKCQHKSAFEILANHPDFIKTSSSNDSSRALITPNLSFFKRKTLVNDKRIIVILFYQFQDPMTPEKIKAALNLVKKYDVLSKFTLQYEDAESKNIEKVIEKYSPKNVTVFDNAISIWVVLSDKRNIAKYQTYRGVNFLLIRKEEATTTEENLPLNGNETIIKTLPENLSMIEIASSFIESVVKRILPDDVVPRQIYKHLFTNGNVEGSFILDSNCREALFIANEVNMSNRNILTGWLSGPGGEYCSWSSKQRDLSSSPCSDAESGPPMTFRISEGNWTRGKWSYKVDVTSKDSISVIVLCRLRKNSLKVIPRLFTKSPAASNTFNASVKNNIVILAASVMYEAKPVLHASVIVDVNSEYEKDGEKSSIPLEDNGIGHDVNKNDGIYTNEFLNFKGNGHYSFSLSVNINGSSEVLDHHQLLKIDDKNLPVVVEIGRQMNYPTFIIRDPSSTFDKVSKEHGEPKSEFSFEELLGDPLTVKPKETPKEKMHLEEIERYESLSIDVVQYKHNFQDSIEPGQVTDLKVIDMSYSKSFVTLEWTSVGAHGFSGTADKIELKFTTDGSAFPSNFHEPGSYVVVKSTNLMDGSSLRPLKPRAKHNVSVKVPTEEGKLYQENAIYFFALAYSGKADNKGLVSNVAFAFFKPEKYSEEIKEIKSQHRSGGLIILVFLFFIGCLGVFICAIKWYNKTRRHSGFSPEQILKYSK